MTNPPSTPVAVTKVSTSPPATPPNKSGVNMQGTKVKSTSHLTVPDFTLPQTPKPAMPVQHAMPTSINVHLAQMSKLVTHVMQQNPNLLPTDPNKEPITSSHINDFTHAMWQVAFQNGGMLQRACQYGAMFSPLKLAALAKLNYLPSWWYLRSVAVTEFKGMQMAFWVDDREEEETFQEAAKWCVKVLGKRVEKSGGEEKAAEGIKRESDDKMMEDQRAFWL